MRPITVPLTRLLVGAFDHYSGIEPDSLSVVADFDVDGRPVDDAAIPAGLEGAHTLAIVLDGTLPRGTATVEPVRYAPETPAASLEDGLRWAAVDGAAAANAMKTGRTPARTYRTIPCSPPRRETHRLETSRAHE